MAVYTPWYAGRAFILESLILIHIRGLRSQKGEIPFDRLGITMLIA